MSHTSTALGAVVFPAAAVISLGASTLLVSRLERLAGKWRISEAMLGLVVALAADSPEVTSAVTASAGGRKVIGAGVVLGSNVFNLAALLGLSAVVAGRVALHRRVVLLDGITGAWVAISALLVLTGGWGAGAGLALVLAAVVPYVMVSGCSTRTLRRLGLPAGACSWLAGAVAEEELELRPAVRTTVHARSDLPVAAFSLVAVVLASTAMEATAQDLGRRLAVPDLVVGGVVLAVVTSLPNAVGAVYLAVRGRGQAVLSEAMNSNMLNVLAGLFLPGLFVGIGGPSRGGTLVAACYAGLTVVVLVMAFAGRGVSRPGGGAIVVSYFGFVAAVLAVS
jgi:cation:H+ antiporter